MITIRTKWLIDGIGSQAMKDATVFVENGRIVQVESRQTEEIPRGTEKLQFLDCTILPGLINLHAHLVGCADTLFYEHLKQESDNMLTLRAAKHAEIALNSGVTTLRDCGSKNRVTLDLRKSIELGIVVGPRLVVCGRPLTTTGGHEWPIGLECDGIDNVRKAVRQTVKDGADFVKIIATGGWTPGSKGSYLQFNVDEIKAAVEEAHKFGKRVVAHVLNRRGILNALKAGVDELAHVELMQRSTGSRAIEADIGEKIAASRPFVHLSLRTVYSRIQQLERKLSQPTSDESKEITEYRNNLNIKLKSFKELNGLGVKIGTGDDAGWSYVTFDGLAQELKLMTMGGMTPLEAITAATKTSAEAIGLENSLGTVESGKIADLLVVRGEPFRNFDDLHSVRLVMKEGSIVHDEARAHGHRALFQKTNNDIGTASSGRLR